MDFGVVRDLAFRFGVPGMVLFSALWAILTGHFHDVSMSVWAALFAGAVAVSYSGRQGEVVAAVESLKADMAEALEGVSKAVYEVSRDVEEIRSSQDGTVVPRLLEYVLPIWIASVKYDVVRILSQSGQTGKWTDAAIDSTLRAHALALGKRCDVFHQQGIFAELTTAQNEVIKTLSPLPSPLGASSIISAVDAAYDAACKRLIEIGGV